MCGSFLYLVYKIVFGMVNMRCAMNIIDMDCVSYAILSNMSITSNLNTGTNVIFVVVVAVESQFLFCFDSQCDDSKSTIWKLVCKEYILWSRIKCMDVQYDRMKRSSFSYGFLPSSHTHTLPFSLSLSNTIVWLELVKSFPSMSIWSACLRSFSSSTRRYVV